MTEEETVLMAFTEFLNAVEAGVAAARQRIKEAKSLWDPDKIKWEQAEGTKGPYERSEDVDNPEFKTMLADLAAHNGRMRHEGFFYWAFQDGQAVGRKNAKEVNKTRAREAEPTASVKPQLLQQEEQLEKVKQLFPEDLQDFLSFVDTGEFLKIVPRQFLGAENFSKILTVVQGKGGKWVSAGKDSHFRIPK